MDIESLLVLALVLGLMSAAALARRFFASGWQRNALSVVIVVLSMVTAFMLFFGLGSVMRGQHSPSQLHGRAVALREAISLSFNTRAPLPASAPSATTE